MTLSYEALKALADDNREARFRYMHEQTREGQLARERADAVLTLKRSQMSAKAKSDFITRHGKEAYFAIPW